MRPMNLLYILSALAMVLALTFTASSEAQIAVRGGVVHTMAGEAIIDGVVLIRDGKIEAVGRAAAVRIPEGYRVLEAAVVTPGLIDARATVGLTGILNQPHDQDQFDRSQPIHPELRAIDAYNTRDPLVAWVRSFGITTVHTGHAPGELITGQTMIIKTSGNTVEEAVMVELAALASTLGPGAQRGDGRSPGTRGKMMAMLRAELIKAAEYLAKVDEAAADDEKSPPARDLRLEAVGRVLSRETPLMISANRAQDIASALRLAEEFNIRLWLEGAAEAYLMPEAILATGVPVFIHPTMIRARGEYENLSFETAAKLIEAGIPVAMQSGYESYVPKSRVVLFEAAIAAANGLSFDQALGMITRDAARMLGIDDRVGTLEPGKDADLALYTGDPFEYTTHCIGVIINGEIVSDSPR